MKRILPPMIQLTLEQMNRQRENRGRNPPHPRAIRVEKKKLERTMGERKEELKRSKKKAV